jgi:D-arabinose 5-phosphate isomerase GutQ
MTQGRPDQPRKLSELLSAEYLLGLPAGHQEHGDDSGPVEAVGSSMSATRPLNLRDDGDVLVALNTRVWAISYAIRETIARHHEAILQGIVQLEQWIRQHEVVRVIGAGRALYAASIPANRLAHAGAAVHVINDVVPLPNSNKDGGILAASASGETQAVLDIMASARRLNKRIVIVGVASARAEQFRSLCDIFIGIEEASGPYENPLRALADTGEYAISELLDAMVVAAGKRLGLTDQDFKSGHEDLGPTGPYSPDPPEG